MEDPKLSYWLAETNPDSTDESDSSWSDVVKHQSDDCEYEDDTDDNLFFPLMQHLLRLRRKRVDDYLHIVESWTDSEFKARLRVPRKIALKLIDDLEKSGFIASHTFGVKPFEPRLCFYIFLTFIANTETLTPIASRFDISISSTFRVIRRVVAWILTKLDEAVRWPQDFIAIQQICDSFYSKTGISGILGVIDATHIKIEKPKNGREYSNTKGYFSIILQATIDSKMRFTNIYCGEPGSCSSSRVLKKSPLYNTATKNKNMLFPENTFLIGHSGYPSLPWLISAYRESKKLTPHQREFNCKHTMSRKTSEKAFNLLKSRFRRIKVFNIYRDIDFITDTVVAACILHNYCLMENDYLADYKK